jgi:plasmid stabilization system protein ParE
VPISVQLHDEAATEYDAAFDWYLQRSPDAALGFEAEFERALTEITTAPDRWARGVENTRRFLLRRFPFVVIYRQVEPGSVQILALAHTSRRPGYWRGRI